MRNNYEIFKKYLTDNGVFPKLKEKIAIFTLAWNSYEMEYYGNKYKPYKIKSEVINNIKLDEEEKNKINNLYDKLLEYFKKRNIDYNLDSIWNNYNFEGGFDHQNIHYEDNVNKTKNLLLKTMNSKDELDRLHFLLLIIGRVRNNMFHGLKTVKMLNENEELFDIANETLILLFINRRYF